MIITKTGGLLTANREPPARSGMLAKVRPHQVWVSGEHERYILWPSLPKTVASPCTLHPRLKHGELLCGTVAVAGGGLKSVRSAGSLFPSKSGVTSCPPSAIYGPGVYPRRFTRPALRLRRSLPYKRSISKTSKIITSTAITKLSVPPRTLLTYSRA